MWRGCKHMNTCSCVCMLKPEINIRCYSPLLSSSFCERSLHEIPASLQDLPASALLHIYTHTHYCPHKKSWS